MAKANALNKDDYKDFSAVEAAINAVVRGKNITEQSEVDAMAKAIEDAIAALQYKEKPKICKGGKEVKISDGAHEMRIHGKSYGTFTFVWVNDKAGWSIQNADGKYLSFDNASWFCVTRRMFGSMTRSSTRRRKKRQAPAGLVGSSEAPR